MDFNAPVRGKTVDGIWRPNSAFEQKEDRSQSGRIDLSATRYSGVLSGASSAESKFKDYQSYLEAIKTVPWVFACVSLLSYSFATAPGDLYDENDEVVEDANDPFLQVWSKPNKFQSGMVFKELMGMFIELAGEAYITLENMDANGVPSELYLPSPARMRVVQDKRTGEVEGYAYDTSGYQNGRYLPSFIPYAASEVIHIKVANPLNMLHGLGNIEAMEVTMDTMVAMTQNELSYWKSGGRITGVLETDLQVDNDTFERLTNRWRQFSADKQLRFKTAILEQGLKYSPISEGFKGLDYSKLDLAKRDFVLANFGVPKNKLGIIEDAQYKSDEADRFFWSETMEPRLSRAEDHLVPLVDLYHPDGDYLWKYERKNFEDDTVKMNNAQMMRNLKVFTQNEIRVYLSVPELPGKAGNSVILQQTDVVVELDAMDKAQAAGVAGGGPPPTKPPDDPKVLAAAHPKPAPHPSAGTNPIAGQPAIAGQNQTGRQSGTDATGHRADNPSANTNPKPAAPAAKYAAFDQLDDDEKAVLIEDYDRQIKGAREVQRNMRRRGLNARVARVKGFSRVVEYGVKRAADVEMKMVQSVPSHRPAIAALVTTTARRTRDILTVRYGPKLREAGIQTRRAMTPVVAKALKIKDAAERHAYLKENLSFTPIIETVAELHTEGANDGWAVGKRTLGFAPKAATVETKAATLTSPFLKQRYNRALAPNAKQITDRMMADVQASITLGLSRAYSALQIANGVADENYGGVSSIFEGDSYDAERIARTESMLAYNWGQGSALLDSGATQEEALDGADDPACAERDGTVYDIDPDTGLAVDDSGDPVRDHPNGTLAFIPTGNLSDLIDSGALDVEALSAEWEGKAAVIGASQAARYHKHRNGVIHAHDDGHDAHGHRWSKMPADAVVPFRMPSPVLAQREAGKAEAKFVGNAEGDIIAALKQATAGLAVLATKYSESQPRDDSGRWGEGSGISGHVAQQDYGNSEFHDHAGDALDLLKTTGGFTYSVSKQTFTPAGSPSQPGPRVFGVSPYKDREKTYDQPITRADLNAYAKANADLLSKSGHNLGGWKNGDGKAVLDVSIVTPSLDEAHAIGARANQEKIFDFLNGVEIPVRKP